MIKGNLAKTVDLIENIKALVKRGALFVVNNSGGKDSQAMAIFISKLVPASQVLNLHASLGEDGSHDEGVEWPDTEAKVREIGNALSFETRVCAANKSLFGMVRVREQKMKEKGTWDNGSPWPSPKYRQCTSDLKRGPLEKAIRAYIKETGHNGIVVNCMGLRAEESSNRAKAKVWKRITAKETNRGAVREWYDWLPIHDWKVGRVFSYIKENGQTHHWAYDKGMSRLSCCFCIMANPNDLTTAAKLRPELYQKYAQMEADMGKTVMMSGKTLPEITGVPRNPQDPNGSTGVRLKVVA